MTENDRILPKVLIVGAGLGGLMTSILLERAGIPYDVFERAPEIKPIGSTMTFNASILPVFEQLGLLEEVSKISKPCKGMNIHDGELQLLGKLDTSIHRERTGYDLVVFARPDMYQLLLSQVPPERLHLGKKIVSVQQDIVREVSIRCADGTEYKGDILIGADGAYSSVRQCMFEEMRRECVLPEADEEELSIGYVCMVGTTEPLENEEFDGAFKDEYARFERIILQGTPHSWSTSTVPGNRICWLMTTQLSTTTSATSSEAKSEAAKTGAFKNIEWGPEANEDMIKEVRDFPCAFGGTMGDLIDATPKDRISRVFLEEKLFETWYYGRIVLIGDACHKMLPSGGSGAINALQDAVILVNSIVDMTMPTAENITTAFRDYRKQRYPQTKYQMDKAKILATIQYDLGGVFYPLCDLQLDPSIDTERADGERCVLSTDVQFPGRSRKSWNDVYPASETIKTTWWKALCSIQGVNEITNLDTNLSSYHGPCGAWDLNVLVLMISMTRPDPGPSFGTSRIVQASSVGSQHRLPPGYNSNCSSEKLSRLNLSISNDMRSSASITVFQPSVGIRVSSRLKLVNGDYVSELSGVLLTRVVVNGNVVFINDNDV
ncbi:hypothetical protein BGZ65_011256 [Modicella reniformis]|uniref:FAD-binding domain-containing protein n=1 Tax=Modicella reniformis TaxID=1440133 RepID=A0A9P6M2G1_9FUNG|nr:hypothetical protein BGZ65_011256 [Modicella reniformis]